MLQGLRAKLKYGGLDNDDFNDLLRSSLRSQSPVRNQLRLAVLRAAFAIRPDPWSQAPDDMLWKHWLAMMLRYLPALNSQARTVAEVRQCMACNSSVVTILLFGTLNEIEHLIDTNFNSPCEKQLTSEQAEVIQLIQYHVAGTRISERQIGNWTNRLLDAWVAELECQLRVPLLQMTARFSERLLRRLSSSDRAIHPSQFEGYLKRFRAGGLDWAYGQALGYYHQIKRRYRIAAQTAQWLAVTGFLSVICALTWLSLTMLGSFSILQLTAIITYLICAVVAGFHFLRIAVLVVGANGQLEAQLQTLAEIEEIFLT